MPSLAATWRQGGSYAAATRMNGASALAKHLLAAKLLIQNTRRTASVRLTAITFLKTETSTMSHQQRVRDRTSETGTSYTDAPVNTRETMPLTWKVATEKNQASSSIPKTAFEVMDLKLHVKEELANASRANANDFHPTCTGAMEEKNHNGKQLEEGHPGNITRFLITVPNSGPKKGEIDTTHLNFSNGRPLQMKTLHRSPRIPMSRSANLTKIVEKYKRQGLWDCLQQCAPLKKSGTPWRYWNIPPQQKANSWWSHRTRNTEWLDKK